MVEEKDKIELDLQKTHRKSTDTFSNCDDSMIFKAALSATKKGKGGKTPR